VLLGGWGEVQIGVTELSRLIGISPRRLRSFVAAGLLRGRRGRASLRDVQTFLLQNPKQVDLCRVHQAWYRWVLFADINEEKRGRKNVDR
jgi:hypothetical protein